MGNTIVAHAHLIDHTEFVNGIKGATVHDAFNFLTVFTFLPLEIITQAAGAGLLLSMSDSMADGLVGASASTFTSPVKILVGPLSKAFMGIDKNIIKGIAKGCIECTIKEKDIGDIGGSVFILIISLVFLCVALYGIVRILHHLVLSSGRVEGTDGKETPFVYYTRKVLRISPYLSILFGMILTICVQSSSITTSALTPLVALQIIGVEDMLPLTLGANIGTTCTAFLAAIVTEKKNAIQIALC